MHDLSARFLKFSPRTKAALMVWGILVAAQHPALAQTIPANVVAHLTCQDVSYSGFQQQVIRADPHKLYGVPRTDWHSTDLDLLIAKTQKCGETSGETPPRVAGVTSVLKQLREVASIPEQQAAGRALNARRAAEAQQANSTVAATIADQKAQAERAAFDAAGIDSAAFQTFATARAYIAALPPTEESQRRLQAITLRLYMMVKDRDPISSNNQVAQDGLYAAASQKGGEIAKIMSQSAVQKIGAQGEDSSRKYRDRIAAFGIPARALDKYIRVPDQTSQYHKFITLRQLIGRMLDNGNIEAVSTRQWEQEGIGGTEVQFQANGQPTAGVILKEDGNYLFPTHIVSGDRAEEIEVPKMAGTVDGMLFAVSGLSMGDGITFLSNPP